MDFGYLLKDGNMQRCACGKKRLLHGVLSAATAMLLTVCLRVDLVSSAFGGSDLSHSKYTFDAPSPTIRILPSNVDLIYSLPHSFVVLEKGPPANIAFCQALHLMNSGAVTSFQPPTTGTNRFGVIFWPDSRLQIDLQQYALGESRGELRCDELVENFDTSRSRALAHNFDLIGSAGPWIGSVNPADGTTVLLDLSCYEEKHFPEAIAKWRKYLIETWSFWITTRDFAMVNILEKFTNEYSERCLTIHYNKNT